MQEPMNLSPQDKRYLHSPSFELYMISGLVFALGMGGSFIITLLLHIEPYFWLGLVLSVVASAVVLQKLKTREYHNKLREIQRNPKESQLASPTAPPQQ